MCLPVALQRTMRAKLLRADDMPLIRLSLQQRVLLGMESS